MAQRLFQRRVVAKRRGANRIGVLATNGANKTQEKARKRTPRIRRKGAPRERARRKGTPRETRIRAQSKGESLLQILLPLQIQTREIREQPTNSQKQSDSTESPITLPRREQAARAQPTQS